MALAVRLLQPLGPSRILHLLRQRTWCFGPASSGWASSNRWTPPSTHLLGCARARGRTPAGRVRSGTSTSTTGSSCSLSNGIGLDVHDPSHFGDVAPYRYQAGDVFTIEPGIYVRENVFDGLPDTDRNRRLIARTRDATRRYRNLGVRVEDNYVLTTGGLVRLSDAPREIADIEALRATGSR